MSRAFRGIRSWLVLTLCLMFMPLTLAQQAPDRPGEGDVRDAMQSFFERRVRAELALTDEQMEHILPRVRRGQEIRVDARRERQHAARELQRGMQEGADDAELQRLLDAMESVEDRQRAEERKVQDEIDAVLSVRQRVQFRIFSQRFRDELQRRIRELQRPEGPRSRPRRRP